MSEARHLPLPAWAAVLLALFGASCTAPARTPPPSETQAPATLRASGVVEQPAPREASVAFQAPEPSSSPTPRPGGPLTFAALLDAALAESPDLAMTAARVAQAEASLREARAAWLPTVGVEASYLRADAPSMYLFKTIDAGRFQNGTNFNAPGAFSNWEAAIGVRYNIYNGGRDALMEEMAGARIDLARLEAAAVENALVAALIDGWYGVRAAEEQLRTAEASIETVDAQLSEARARFELGSGLQTDVLSLEVRRAESEELRLRAENGRELGLAVLAQLAGLSASSELELLGEGPRGANTVRSLEDAQERAERDRPELAQAREQVRQAERGLRAADSSYLPRADAFARGWRDAPELDFDDSRDNWALGVSLSWDLFEGRRGAGVDGARGALDEARRGLQKARLGVQLDVRSAWLSVQDARKRLEVSERAAATAERTLALVRDQFEGGAAPVTRYLEAELMNTRARTRLTNARFDLARAGADLTRAIGGHHAARETSDKRS